MTPKTSLPQPEVRWTRPEVHGFAAAALRDMATEKAAGGDQPAARELERMASASDVARRAALAGTPTESQLRAAAAVDAAADEVLGQVRMTKAEREALRLGAHALAEIALAMAAAGHGEEEALGAESASALDDLRRRAVVETARAAGREAGR